MKQEAWQLTSSIAPAAPATPCPATGDEFLMRPEFGFAPVCRTTV